jgi:hypothetical protein
MSNQTKNGMKTTMTNWMRGLAMFAIVIGTVHIPRAAVANGAGLPAGTYTVRVADDQLTVPAGQSPDAEKWVEFVQGGKVVAKEVASVISAADMPSIAKGARPRTNGTLLQTLKGGDYFRVWINKGGTNYLINLAIGKPVVK